MNTSHEGERMFLDDLRRGMADLAAGRLASPEETRRVLDRLARMQTMKHFDDLHFRTVVLLNHKDQVHGLTEDELAELSDAWDELSPAAQDVAMELAEDSVLLVFDEERERALIAAVEDQLAVGECGKALKLLRSSAPYLSPDLLRSWRRRIWLQVARVDPRFEEIASDFERD